MSTQESGSYALQWPSFAGLRGLRRLISCVTLSHHNCGFQRLRSLAPALGPSKSSPSTSTSRPARFCGLITAAFPYDNIHRAPLYCHEAAHTAPGGTSIKAPHCPQRGFTRNESFPGALSCGGGGAAAGTMASVCSGRALRCWWERQGRQVCCWLQVSLPSTSGSSTKISL